LNLFGAGLQNEYQVPCERKKGMITRRALIPIGVLLWILPQAAHGQTRPSDIRRDRFVIEALTPSPKSSVFKAGSKKNRHRWPFLSADAEKK